MLCPTFNTHIPLLTGTNAWDNRISPCVCVCVRVCAVWQTSDAGGVMPLTLSHTHIHILQESMNGHSAAARTIKTSQKGEEEEEDER